MKNSASILSIVFTLICSPAIAQQAVPFSAMKQQSVNVSLLQAFTDKGEIQLGWEKQSSKYNTLELSAGFRFTGSNDPGNEPYYNETFVKSEIKQVQKGVQFFLFLPIPVTGRDKDWVEKTTWKETYTNHNVYVTVGTKYYVLPFQRTKLPGGIYLAPAVTLGNRGITEYNFAEGQRGYVDVLDSEFLPNGEPNPWAVMLGTGFIGNQKVVQEDLYTFNRMQKKEYSKTYLNPSFRLGVQIPVGGSFSLDLGGQATFQGKLIGKSDTSPFRLEPTVKAGYWF